MISPEQALIQVHYHNGSGGVSRVMQEYHSAFKRLTSKGHSYLFCSKKASFDDIDIIDADCDYAVYDSIESFENSRNILREKMLGLLDTLKHKPIVIICHNLSLGKNAALSAALADIAAMYKGWGQIRFFWLIHDLIEEGRMNLLAQVNKLNEMGIDIWGHLYPRSGFTYVTLNLRDKNLFEKCGVSAELMPNYIPPPRAVENEIVSGMAGFIREEILVSADISENSQLFFYPVRVISRKNVIEAVILTVLKHNGILILGRNGNNPKDTGFSEKLREICEENRLPVIFDIEAHVRKAGFILEDVFAACCWACDWCISTSVAEGFGYGLYEPWAYSRPVLGRAPENFIPSGEISLDHLYRHFFVPAEWIAGEYIRSRYFSHLSRLSISDSRGIGADIEKVISSDKIDFGLLDHSQQFMVLNRLLSDRSDLKAVESPLHGQMKHLSRQVISENRQRVENFYTRGFDGRFENCYFAHRETASDHPFDSSILRNFFMKPGTSRLLLVAHY